MNKSTKTHLWTIAVLLGLIVVVVILTIKPVIFAPIILGGFVGGLYYAVYSIVEDFIK